MIVGFDQVRLSQMIARVARPKRPPLGVLGANARDYLARHPEAAGTRPVDTEGVFVGDVRAGSVAERAGLRKGDVIVGFTNKRVKDMAGLDRLVAMLGAGSRASVRVLRVGGEVVIEAQF
ncbi:MAG: PDZ domain-containing protein [Thermomicrobiales bacterium]